MIGVAVTSTAILTPDGAGYHGINTGTANQAGSGFIQCLPEAERIGECRIAFPEGPAGPLIMRNDVIDAETGDPLAMWVRNRDGNFYYDISKGTLYKLNSCCFNRDLTIMRLPTDSSPLANTINRINGGISDWDQALVRNGLNNSLACPMFSRKGQEIGLCDHPNADGEAYFNHPWNEGVQVKDLRDAFHRQGWSYFTITGQFNGKKVAGYGCMPFVMAHYGERDPWVYLTIGGKRYFAEKGHYPLGFRPALGGFARDRYGAAGCVSCWLLL